MHPFILHVFCQKETAIQQYREYTFSVRAGRKPHKHDPLAWLAGWLTSKLVCSLQAVPVYRDHQSIKTIRIGLEYLLRGESLIIWPDIHYTNGYDAPCTIYSGFLLLGELYERKTGQQLKFVPLYIDDHNRQILAHPAVSVSSFQQDQAEATALLQRLLNTPPDSSQTISL